MNIERKKSILLSNINQAKEILTRIETSIRSNDYADVSESFYIYVDTLKDTVEEIETSIPDIVESS